MTFVAGFGLFKMVLDHLGRYGSIRCSMTFDLFQMSLVCSDPTFGLSTRVLAGVS